MTVSDWLIIGAVIIGPILAVQIQKFIGTRKEKRERKMRVFKTLMATRATPLSPYHVESLNMIDIEFYKNKNIVDAWKLLLDHFANYPKDPKEKDYETRLMSCSEKANNLLTDLLYEMAKVLGYNFDKVLLKRGCYIPKGHGDIELEQTIIRRSLAELFLGRKSLPINIVESKKEENKQGSITKRSSGPC